MKLRLKVTLALVLLSGPALLYGNPGDTLQWFDARRIGLEGQGWKDDSLFYDRLPANAKGVVPDAVWDLSRQSAGLYVHFYCDAPAIRARWNLTLETLGFPHFAPTGVSGLDLYVKLPDGSWHWLGVGKPRKQANLETIVEGMPAGRREYMLYLPLYNGIRKLEIGIPAGYTLEKAPVIPGKPIVIYGTSIIQGGCASRPGMGVTAILGRRLNRPVINLGFSGSGRMEPEVARILAELDPALFFIDCLPNLEANEVAARVEPFVRILREKHPETPIVLVEGVTYNDAFLVTKRNQRNVESRKALRNAFENLLNSGMRNLYYQVAEGQLGNDGEGTVALCGRPMPTNRS
jgi:hypothetical protein